VLDLGGDSGALPGDYLFGTARLLYRGHSLRYPPLRKPKRPTRIRERTETAKAP